jgi:hypothetical protein
MTKTEQQELAARIVADYSFVFESEGADLAKVKEVKAFFLGAAEEVACTLKLFCDAEYSLDIIKEYRDYGRRKIYFLFEKNEFFFSISVLDKNGGGDVITPEKLFDKAKEFLLDPKKAAEAAKRGSGDRRPKTIVEAALIYSHG